MSKKLAYIIFGLNKDNTEIVVLGGSQSRDYSDFTTELPETECRWAVYDLEYETSDGGKRNKLVFFSWCAVILTSPLTVYSKNSYNFHIRLIGLQMMQRSSRRWFSLLRGMP